MQVPRWLLAMLGLGSAHDISPSLEEQLVLELECWIVVEEVADVLPQEPANRMIRVPKGHSEGLKIPQDWAECGEPFGTQHHFVPRQGKRRSWQRIDHRRWRTMLAYTRLCMARARHWPL